MAGKNDSFKMALVAVIWLLVLVFLISLVATCTADAQTVTTPVTIYNLVPSANTDGVLLGVPRNKTYEHDDTILVTWYTTSSGQANWAVSFNHGASWATVESSAGLGATNQDYHLDMSGPASGGYVTFFNPYSQPWVTTLTAPYNSSSYLQTARDIGTLDGSFRATSCHTGDSSWLAYRATDTANCITVLFSTDHFASYATTRVPVGYAATGSSIRAQIQIDPLTGLPVLMWLDAVATGSFSANAGYYYSRATGATTFGAPQVIFTGTYGNWYYDRYMGMAIFNGTPTVVVPYNSAIVHLHGGQSDTVSVLSNANPSAWVDVTIRGGTMWAFWNQQSQSGNYGPIIGKKYDATNGWDADSLVITTDSTSNISVPPYSGEDISLVWQDMRTWNIKYARLTGLPPIDTVTSSGEVINLDHAIIFDQGVDF